MATFLFIMIVLALLALVVTLVVFTLSQREGPTAKSARQLPRPLPGITGFHTDFDRITLP